MKSAEEQGKYEMLRPATLDEIIAFTRNRLFHKFKRSNYLTSPELTKEYLRATLATLEHEVFGTIHLDNRHGILEWEELFRGTIDGASVHPREIVKSALLHNSAALILAHNHPSGLPEPSQADQRITQRIKEAVQHVDIRILDHLIVGADEITSMAERGLI